MGAFGAGYRVEIRLWEGPRIAGRLDAGDRVSPLAEPEGHGRARTGHRLDGTLLCGAEDHGHARSRRQR
jgi:hypothetical protein